MLEIGQRVRLSERGLRVHKSTQKLDWSKRLGTLARFSPQGTRALVIWDGNKTASDPLPLEMLQPFDDHDR